tara:strand:+ start:213 stop:677 length:465 start_codon:yes stop_codon:yes gene_type:complete
MTDSAEFRHYQAGLNSVGSYQMSGIPYASSSITVEPSDGVAYKVEFPYVARTLTIRNDLATASTDVALRVGFSKNGVENTGGEKYYFILTNGESYTADWRIEDLYLLGDSETAGVTASIVASLTGIRTGSVPGISDGTDGEGTADNWSGSIGVG